MQSTAAFDAYGPTAVNMTRGDVPRVAWGWARLVAKSRKTRRMVGRGRDVHSLRRIVHEIELVCVFVYDLGGGGIAGYAADSVCEVGGDYPIGVVVDYLIQQSL